MVEIELGLASHDCGQKITEKNVKELGDRLQHIGGNKYFLPKFIRFQYGALSAECRPHQKIIALIQAHGIIRDGLDYKHPNAGKNGNQAVLPFVPTPPMPVVRGFEKPTVEICKEQAKKIQIPESEGEKFFNYYESNGWKVGKNPMKSWVSAMNNWKTNYNERQSSNPGRSGGRNAGTGQNPSTVGNATGNLIRKNAATNPAPASH